MSYNEKLCGVSYKVLDKTSEDERYEYLKRLMPDETTKAEELHGDDKEEILYDVVYSNDNKNEWRLMIDYHGCLGWVYVTDSGESNGDINFKMNYSKFLELAQELREKMREDVDLDKFSIFAIDWYNGADCSFIF